MRTRTKAWAMNSLLSIDGVSASPSEGLHKTGMVMVIPPEKVFIVTGVSMGPTTVDVEPLDSRPAAEAEDDMWEDVAEFTVRRVPGVAIKVHGEMELPSPDAPDLAPDDAPLVRIRISAKGRDLEHDLAVTEPLEHYLVQVWPARDFEDSAPPWSRTTTEVAASRRSSKQLPPNAGGATK